VAFIIAFYSRFYSKLEIYIVQKVLSFWESSLLTVDLGQQICDFFSLLSTNFLEDPSQFFLFFFKKQIGWGYGLGHLGILFNQSI